MKILAFSDSHGYYNRILRIIEQHPDADAIIHCGDMLNDAKSIKTLIGSKKPVYYVIGNNDFAPNEPKELSLEFEGKKILVTHGHLYGVKSGTELLRQKVKDEYDLVLYGHTHKADTEYFGKGIVLNPGAMCYSSKSSYAIITIEDGVLKTRIELP